MGTAQFCAEEPYSEIGRLPPRWVLAALSWSKEHRPRMKSSRGEGVLETCLSFFRARFFLLLYVYIYIYIDLFMCVCGYPFSGHPIKTTSTSCARIPVLKQPTPGKARVPRKRFPDSRCLFSFFRAKLGSAACRVRFG